MTSPIRLAKIGAGVIAGAGLLYWLYSWSYAEPIGQRQARLDALKAQLRGLESNVAKEAEVERKLMAFGQTTLGKKEDVATARFRDALSKIAESCGLGEVVVNSGSPTAVINPAATGKGIPSSVKSKLRTPDFMLIKGRLKGAGQLEQVVRALAVVQAQPWAHRVEGFSITPLGRERERYEIQIDVGTLLAPDLCKVDADPTIGKPADGSEGVWRAVAAKNVFKNPPPPKPPEQPVVVAKQDPPVPPPAPAPPPPPPYGDWKVVGIVSGSRGLETMLVNTKSGERLTLMPGGKALDAVLISGTTDGAVFEIGGQRYEFVPGQTLAARTAARP